MASYAQCVEAYIQYRARVGYKILKRARASKGTPKSKLYLKRVWTEERDLEMRILATSGMNTREISEEMGIGWQSVKSHAQYAKIKTGKRKGGRLNDAEYIL